MSRSERGMRAPCPSCLRGRREMAAPGLTENAVSMRVRSGYLLSRLRAVADSTRPPAAHVSTRAAEGVVHRATIDRLYVSQAIDWISANLVFASADIVPHLSAGLPSVGIAQRQHVYPAGLYIRTICAGIVGHVAFGFALRFVERCRIEQVLGRHTHIDMVRQMVGRIEVQRLHRLQVVVEPVAGQAQQLQAGVVVAQVGAQMRIVVEQIQVVDALRRAWQPGFSG